MQRFTVGRKIEKGDTLKPEKDFAGLKGIFSHVFIYENTKRTYADKYPQSGFYDTIYINKSATFDSLSNRVIRNTVRFDFATDEKRKFRVGGGAGIRNDCSATARSIRLTIPHLLIHWHGENQIMPWWADF